MTLRRTTCFVEIVVVIPNLNDTEIKEVFLEGNNSQINTSTETHNETVKEKFLKHQGVGEQYNQ